MTSYRTIKHDIHPTSTLQIESVNLARGPAAGVTNFDGIVNYNGHNHSVVGNIRSSQIKPDHLLIEGQVDGKRQEPIEYDTKTQKVVDPRTHLERDPTSQESKLAIMGAAAHGRQAAQQAVSIGQPRTIPKPPF